MRCRETKYICIINARYLCVISITSVNFVYHHHHQSINRQGRWGTKDNFVISFLHFSMFSTALWDLANSFFLCLPCLLLPFTVPCKMVLAWPDEQVACVSEDPRCLRAWDITRGHITPAIAWRKQAEKVTAVKGSPWPNEMIRANVHSDHRHRRRETAQGH